MEVPVKFMVERLQGLPNHAFIISDGSKVYAAVRGELIIFTGQPGEFNAMTEHELGAFIRANWDKKGTVVAPSDTTDEEMNDGESTDL
jgi:hypothetical protein